MLLDLVALLAAFIAALGVWAFCRLREVRRDAAQEHERLEAIIAEQRERVRVLQGEPFRVDRSIQRRV